VDNQWIIVTKTADAAITDPCSKPVVPNVWPCSRRSVTRNQFVDQAFQPLGSELYELHGRSDVAEGVWTTNE
jgi:hypothetical protein